MRKNARHLDKWARRERVTCWRVYDRDIPEIPITVDTYEGALVINDYRAFERSETGGGDPDGSAGGAGGRAPRGIDPEAAPAAAERGAGRPRMREPERRQVELRSVDLDSLLSMDHAARVIWRYVEQLDLSVLEEAIEAREHTPGQAPATSAGNL